MRILLSAHLKTEFRDLRRWQRIALEAGGEAVYQYLIDYHRNMDWRGPNWFAGRDSGRFQESVWKGWQPPKIRGARVTIVNNFGLLDWKVKGGVIRPVQAKALTIPLIPAAKRVPARGFGTPLFVAGNTLSAIIGGKLEAIYSLRRAVAQAPWPGAMPKDDVLKFEFVYATELAFRQRFR